MMNINMSIKQSDEVLTNGKTANSVAASILQGNEKNSD
jgi:hypothetical protein